MGSVLPRDFRVYRSNIDRCWDKARRRDSTESSSSYGGLAHGDSISGRRFPGRDYRRGTTYPGHVQYGSNSPRPRGSHTTFWFGIRAPDAPGCELARTDNRPGWVWAKVPNSIG